MLRILPPFWNNNEFYKIIYSIFSKNKLNNSTCLFQQELENIFNPNKIILTNSGRAAIYIILKSLNLVEGSKVIVPSFICPAVITSIVKANMTPQFVDIKDDLTMNPDSVEKAFDNTTKVILMSHVYGKICDYKSISLMAIKRGVNLIDDAAPCAGLKVGDRTTGDLGDFGILSMNHKVSSSLMGGAIICTDKARHSLQNILKIYSKNESASNRVFLSSLNMLLSRIAYKSNLSELKMLLSSKSLRDNDFIYTDFEISSMHELSAAIGLVQLKKLNALVEKRKVNSEILKSELSNIKEIAVFGSDIHDFYTRFVIKINGFLNDDIKKDIRHEWVEMTKFRKYLHDNKIQTFSVYTPNHLILKTNNHLPKTEDLWKRSVVIPNNPLYGKEDMMYISNSIKSYFRN